MGLGARISVVELFRLNLPDTVPEMYCDTGSAMTPAVERYRNDCPNFWQSATWDGDFLMTVVAFILRKTGEATFTILS